MQITRRLVLTMTMTGLGLAAGSVLAVDLAAPASAVTTTSAAQSVATSRTCHWSRCRHLRRNVSRRVNVNPNVNVNRNVNFEEPFEPFPFLPNVPHQFGPPPHHFLYVSPGCGARQGFTVGVAPACNILFDSAVASHADSSATLP